MGGTRNGFNRIARKPGAQAGGGITYALVGWKGAGEGEGQEIGGRCRRRTGGPVAAASWLRPDRQSRMRPIESDAGSASPSPITMLEPPTSTWPLAKDCQKRDGVARRRSRRDARAELAAAGREETKEEARPRSAAAYPEQPFNKARWDGLATIVHRRT